jgi:hypothetical protein
MEDEYNHNVQGLPVYSGQLWFAIRRLNLTHKNRDAGVF